MGEQLNYLLTELNRLHHRNELAKTVSTNYFEPGMMEYLDKSEEIYNHETREVILRFEAKGTRYDGRTEGIEKMNAVDIITIIRDSENPYNPNNFTMENARGNNVGNMPMELCNAIAPLYDSGALLFEEAFVKFSACSCHSVFLAIFH